jgi:Arc/MetJ-type ribon-helix-helix transcriptional regulator
LRENIVSFRINAELVQELKMVAKEGHYLDLCELIRAIVRKQYMLEKYPVAYELENIKNELKAELRRERDG